MEQLIAAPLLVVLCYLTVTAVKGTHLPTRLYPLVSALCGVAYGVAVWYLEPELLTGVSDVRGALLRGLVSGLAATGTDQLLKRLIVRAASADGLTLPETAGQNMVEALLESEEAALPNEGEALHDREETALSGEENKATADQGKILQDKEKATLSGEVNLPAVDAEAQV